MAVAGHSSAHHGHAVMYKQADSSVEATSRAPASAKQVILSSLELANAFQTFISFAPIFQEVTIKLSQD